MNVEQGQAPTQGARAAGGRLSAKALFSRRAQATVSRAVSSRKALTEQHQKEAVKPSRQNKKRRKEAQQHPIQQYGTEMYHAEAESDEEDPNDKSIWKKGKLQASSSCSNTLYIPDWNIRLNDTIFDDQVALNLGKALLLANDREDFSFNTIQETHRRLIITLAQGLAAAVQCWEESDRVDEERKLLQLQAESERRRGEELENEIMALKQCQEEVRVVRMKKDERIRKLEYMLKGLLDTIEDLKRVTQREMSEARRKIDAERARADKAELILANQKKEYTQLFESNATHYVEEGFNECCRLVKWLWPEKDVGELKADLVANIPEDVVVPPLSTWDAACS